MFNYLKQMYETQKELNTTLVSDWGVKLTTDNWKTAILVETAEAIDSLDWKWWKKQELDTDNLKVELIDILHFLLSLSYYSGKKNREEAFRMFIIGNERGFSYRKYDKNTFLKELNLIPCTPLKMKFESVGFMLGKLGYNVEGVVGEYLTKEVLNLFRYNHGYKEGAYKKDWNGVEDNVVAFKLAKGMRVTDTFKDRFTDKLEAAYKEVE